MNWKRVTIFISSTFNDMHAERDYLVKDVFPELREWCEERKIHLVDVDLRWGVTEEDSSSNHTVLACLNNIDESRPFFLCFLGQRRGWVPEKGDVSPETLDEYPDISDTISRHSVTEMEIEHALLSPMRHIVNGNEKQEIPVRHALFYFRNPDYLNDLTIDQRKIFTNEAEKNIALADNELIKFKGKIKNRWKYTIDYDCNWDKQILSPELPENVQQGRLTDFSASGKALKDIIVEQLKEEIIKEFPDREKVEYSSDLERDLDQQALFLELNSEGFVSREGDFDALNDYVTNDKNGLFVLTAPAGSGKSMLLANYIIKESKKHNARFINRFCGVSDLCSQQYSLWKTIFNEVHIACPDTLKALKDKFKDLLKDLAKEKTVLIIDAINQLPDGLDMLDWLPKQLPENLKVILSLKEDERNKELTGNISLSTVKPFKGKEEKKKLINDYLKKYLKALGEQQIDTICDFEGSKNPLYLKILLSELRIFGSFGQLSKEIQQFGVTPKEAFNTVLNRLENDVNSLNIDSKTFTPLLFGLLANARNGLSEKEIVSCMQKELSLDEGKLIQAVRLFIRQVRPFMARREGRIDYFYEAFKLAAKEKYIHHKVHHNKLLAGYFKEQADLESDLSFKGTNIRDFNELPYHLKESENMSDLEEILSTYRWIKNKIELSDIYNIISDYKYIKETEDNYYIQIIEKTLILSQHHMKENKKSLSTQLWGRLKNIENSEIKELLTEIDKYTDFPWLKPHHYMNTSEGALIVTLTGHRNSRVYSVCAFPDGRYVVSGGGSTICVWDWEKQEEIVNLEVPYSSVYSVCVSPNGKYIASGQNKIVRVWDWEKRKEISKLGGHIGEVRSICFSNDGQYLVSGSGEFGEGNTVRVWDWEKQEEIKNLEGHTDSVNSVCVFSSGRYIISGSDDRTVRVWDWENKREIVRLEEHTGSVRSVCVSNDGKYIASGYNSTVCVWDWEKQKRIAELEEESYSPVYSICFSSDGEYITSGLHDGSVRVWDWKNKREIRKLEGHTSGVLSVCVSPDGKYIASGSMDNTVRFWEWKRQEEVKKREEHAGSVYSVCFSGDGRHIVSGSVDSTIRVWVWKTQKEIRKLEGHTSGVLSVCFSPDGKYIASGSADHTVCIWDWEKQEQIRKLEGHTGSVDSVCFSPDGQYITSGSTDKTVRVWDWENKREMVKLEGHIERVSCVCISCDKKYIVSGSADNTIRVWDWKNKREIRKLGGEHISNVDCVCISRDGKFIVVGYGNGFVRVWDLETQKEIKKSEGHTGSVNSVYFSRDERYIVSGAWDNTIRIWDWKNPEETQSLTILLNTEDATHSCVFSNDNYHLVAGGQTGQIFIYDIKNLPIGIAMVTALRDLDNHLSVRCRYCAEIFNVPEDKLGAVVKCPYCNEELQVNDFTADTLIVEDEESEVETGFSNVFGEDKEDLENNIENVVNSNNISEKNDFFKDEKKKGFFSRLFKR